MISLRLRRILPNSWSWSALGVLLGLKASGSGRWSGAIECSCQAETESLKVRLANHLSLRRDHTVGMERVLARVDVKLALKKASAVFPKLPHGSLDALDMSHQLQSSGPP